MKPTIGRIVHYVLSERDCAARPSAAGEIRPAIIVRVWSSDNAGRPDGETVQLQVFTDGSNDGVGKDGNRNVLWATSVHHDEEKKPGTWHWPPRPKAEAPVVQKDGGGDKDCG